MGPLITSVMDLDSALGGNAGLLLGGGLGLYLRQEHLRATGARTRIALDRLPPARTTQDIDLFLRAEVIASTEEVARYRAALDSLGFKVVAGSEWLKFRREVGGTEVLLDIDRLLAPKDGLGRIRLLEYQRDSGAPILGLDPDFLVRELHALLEPSAGSAPWS